MIHRGIELSGARHNCHMSLQSQLRQEVQKAPVTKNRVRYHPKLHGRGTGAERLGINSHSQCRGARKDVPWH